MAVAFNDIMSHFLADLTAVFPDDPAVLAAPTSFDTLRSMNVRKPMQMFVVAMEPHVALLRARDPVLFERLDMPGIDLATLWRGDLTDDTRTAIWDYLMLLYGMAQVGSNAAGPNGGLAGLTGTGGSLDVGKMMQLVDQGGALNGKDPGEFVDKMLEGVPEDVITGMKGLAKDVAEKMKDGTLGPDDLVDSIMSGLEGLDLGSIEIDSATMLARLKDLGVDAGSLLTGGTTEESELLRSLDEPADAKPAKKPKTPRVDKKKTPRTEKKNPPAGRPAARPTTRPGKPARAALPPRRK